jgi:hypothetical protein
MAVMKSGGSAVDAVEIAIKVLEDREITNAGFGSNLGYGGVVECDSIIVNHHGSSGAAGAVARKSFSVLLQRPLAHVPQKSRIPSRLPDSSTTTRHRHYPSGVFLPTSSWAKERLTLLAHTAWKSANTMTSFQIMRNHDG